MLISCGVVTRMTDQKVYHAIKVSLEDKVATVELARPDKSNALNDDMWQEIPQVRPGASQDPCTACWAERAVNVLLQALQALDASKNVQAVRQQSSWTSFEFSM